jgi:flagellar hook-associated protein 1 FlgK
MSDLLSIGASGVRAYQTALSTTSDNIANAGTAGYVRRTTSLQEMGNGSSRDVKGNGVAVTGISRSADTFRSMQVRLANADLSRSDTGISWLQQIEQAVGGQALDDRLTAFFNTGTALSADPSGDAPRTAMLEAAQSVAQAFSGTVKALDNATANLDIAADNAATRLSDSSAVLARINDSLSRVTAGSAGQAQLLDQRDKTLDDMSQITNLDVQFDPVGRVTVRAGGAGGPLLVHGNETSAVRYGRNEDGAPEFTVFRGGKEMALYSQAGSMAGMIDGAGRISEMRATAVKLAGDFVGGVNDALAKGQDLDGAAGAKMFAIDTSGIVTRTMTDTRTIAAAANGMGPRDGGNLKELTAARKAGSFEQRTVALQSANGAALSARQTVADAQRAVRDGAVDTRDASAGVNLDQEGVDLLRFQQAYQASSRVIQVARETFDSLLQIR